MPTRRFAVLIPLLMLAAQPVVHARDARSISLSAAQQASHEHAMQSFREQRYAAAYGRFAHLADAGHAPSARLALVMYANGSALFGNRWSATIGQQRRWNALAAAGARLQSDVDDDERGD